MNATVYSLLVGQRRDRIRFHFPIAVGLFLVTFFAYRVGFFSVSGGLLVIPGQAAFLGLMCAMWVGFRSGGMLLTWMIVYGAILGFHVQRGLFSYPGRSLSERIDLILSLDTLLVWGSMAVVLGTIAFFVGKVVGQLWRAITTASPDEN